MIDLRRAGQESLRHARAEGLVPLRRLYGPGRGIVLLWAVADALAAESL